jgi:thioredoxin 1
MQGDKKDEKINKDKKEDSKIIFMDFYANWCGPCKKQDPIIEDLKKKFEKRVEFIKIDVDKDDEFTDKYEVKDIPTIIIEREGKFFAKFVGETKAYILEKKLREIIGDRKGV